MFQPGAMAALTAAALFSAVLAVAALGEAVTAPLLVAAAPMVLGLWLYVSERDEHGQT